MSPTSHPVTTPLDPLEILARDDKWQLGAGDGVMFAPTFPLWLERPGFWDDATVHHFHVGPLFTVSILDEDGKEVRASPSERRWSPAELIVEYRLSNGMQATEVRTVHPGGIFVSEWRLRAFRRGKLHFVAWTRCPVQAIEATSLSWNGALVFERSARDARGSDIALRTELGCAAGATSWFAIGAEPTGPPPDWSLTPFVERWRPDGLPKAIRPLAGPELYGAVHREITVDGESAAAVFAMRLTPVDAKLQPRDAPVFAAHAFTLGGVSRRRWRERFDDVPQFRCSDPYFELYYWYRWYTLFLNLVHPGVGNFGAACLTAGPGASSAATATGVTRAVRDLRWLADPEIARATLRAFFEQQPLDGVLPSALRVTDVDERGALDARWGDAILAVHDALPDLDFLAEAYSSLAAHARAMVKACDPQATGVLRSRGTDAVMETTTAYEIFRALERMATELQRSTDAHQWKALAGRTAAAIRGPLWDARIGSFRDPAAADARVRAEHFAPWLTDVADERHIASIESLLLDTEKFWTPFPVPSFVVRDPAASADTENTSARGRVDPAIDCLLVEALARAGRYQPSLLAAAAHLLRRFVHMMFHEGDLRRPNAYEHYNPFTGHASVYRGSDDGSRGSVADLIVGYVAGVRPQANGILIDPLPLGLEQVEFGPAALRGHELHVRIDGGRVMATLDGVRHETTIGSALLLADR